MSDRTEAAYTFNQFELDCASGEVRREGRLLAIRPKVYALLVYLVSRQGRLIPKDELIRAIWGDVSVSDGSLNRAIAELRSALGDESEAPRLIETVPRRGYKFIGNVIARQRGAERTSGFILITGERTIPLPVGETIIGRTPECSVQIIGPSVSRRHARIVISDDGAAIEDLQSLNGTYVGDEKIKAPTPLKHGDQLRIGKERVRFLSDATFRARTEPAF